MPAASGHADDSSDDHDEQGGHEEIRGNHEGHARVMHSTKIENGDGKENTQTEKNRVRLKRWTCRDQRADTRRNPNRGSENVIGEERGSSEQSGKRAEIHARDGIGTATSWIRGDGLQIREEDDKEERNDGQADRHDVLHTEQTQGNQQTEGSFGAIRGGTQSVEAEDGDALCRADLFGPFFGGFQRLANNQIQDLHGEWVPSTISGVSICNELQQKVNSRQDATLDPLKPKPFTSNSNWSVGRRTSKSL